MLIAHNLIWKSYQAEHFSFIAWDDKSVKNKNKIKTYISTFGKRMQYHGKVWRVWVFSLKSPKYITIYVVKKQMKLLNSSIKVEDFWAREKRRRKKNYW